MAAPSHACGQGATVGAAMVVASMAAGIALGVTAMALAAQGTVAASKRGWEPEAWVGCLSLCSALPLNTLRVGMCSSLLVCVLLLVHARGSLGPGWQPGQQRQHDGYTSLLVAVMQSGQSAGVAGREDLVAELVGKVRLWMEQAGGTSMHAAQRAHQPVKGAANTTQAVPNVQMSAASVLQLAALEQELFCSHVHPLPMPQATPVKVNNLPGVARGSLVQYVYKKGDSVSEHIREGGIWEEDDLAELEWAMTTALPPDAAPTSAHTPGLFVDVGANVGAFFLFAAARGFESIGFEAMRSNQLLIRSSLCASKHGLAQRARPLQDLLAPEQRW